MIPRSLWVGPHKYRVLSEERKTDDFGETNTHRCEIRINRDQCLSQQRETFLHEAIHACTSLTGLQSELGDDFDEKVATRLAPVLLDVLRRNPRAVEFLTG